MRMIDEAALIEEAETGHWDIDIKELKMILKYVPTIDAVPVVRGRWRTWEEQFADRTTRKKNNLGVFCSACQLHADNMTSFCPNCGALMEDKP